MPTNDIGQDRFQSRLTKELRIKGAMPSPVLAPEIVPVVIVEGERPELQHLAHEHRFCCTLTLGNVAGEYYYFQLWNPAGRNGLIVVEEFGVCDETATGSFDFGYAYISIKASLGVRHSYCLDTRIATMGGQAGEGEPVVGTDPGAGSLHTFGRVRALLDTASVIQPNVVLTPGHGFSLWNLAQQQDVSGWCIWRERRAQDGELI